MASIGVLDRAHRTSQLGAAAAVAASAAVTAGAVQRRRTRRRRDAERRYRLCASGELGAELRRVARGRIDAAVEELEAGLPSDPDRGVHEARKSLKRTRSLVRAARAELGAQQRAHENAELRELGRRLSGTRDARAVLDALEQLEQRYGDDLDPRELESVRGRLQAEYEAALSCIADSDGPVVSVLDDLRFASARVDTWPLDGTQGDALVVGARRIYRRGRRAYRKARDDPSVENLHEWRKRAKDLRYAAELLRAAAPKRLKTTRAQARELSDLLGDDHDLAVLAERVADAPVLAMVIERRRAELETRAFEIGAQLYRRRPRRFAKAIRRGMRKRTIWCAA
jgi:CHAD domain-containing protein